MENILVRYLEHPKLKDPIFIEGLPGIGNVGKLAAEHLKDELKGVKFADVRANSPAALAGFKAGDVLVEFDGKPIENLQDFTYVLRSKKPGDEVMVKVLRNGEPVTAKVTLTRRD